MNALETKNVKTAIIEEVCAGLKHEFGDRLLGIVLGGSYATDSYDGLSDYDFHALTTDPETERRAYKIDGAPIDLFIKNPATVYREIGASHSHAMLTYFADAQILYQKSDTAQSLIAHAQSVLNAGRPEPSVGQTFYRRSRIEKMILSLRRHHVVVSQSAELMTVAQLLLDIVDLHLALEKKTLNKPSRTGATIEKENPELMNLMCSAVIVAPNVSERLQEAYKLVTRDAGPMPIKFSNRYVPVFRQ